ncbi:hypothetical protein DAPPUDRAFT_262472 [Daphnia pulex]|uniref:Uncharacterized protein n=1 Tax=Daphnia pulex TaxID=6669 RepID=E9HN22_DAPPU|nr:hypothetical protein DAPPUDRAFT_262472 [Daphnia pulex]|eukprot:EFX66867.1 hypothetical protein DAPPUDRAFT_262472 [Daphnia pulex]
MVAAAVSKPPSESIYSVSNIKGVTGLPFPEIESTESMTIKTDISDHSFPPVGIAAAAAAGLGAVRTQLARPFPRSPPPYDMRLYTKGTPESVRLLPHTCHEPNNEGYEPVGGAWPSQLRRV